MHRSSNEITYRFAHYRISSSKRYYLDGVITKSQLAELGIDPDEDTTDADT